MPAEITKELVDAYGGDVIQTEKLEKGGITVTLREEGSVTAMSDMKDF